MINNYEQEIIHDILYEARGKGYITDEAVFKRAFPMIMGFGAKVRHCGLYSEISQQYNISAYKTCEYDVDEFVYSELNFLQSYHVFDSIKRIIELNKLRVITAKKNKENRILDCLYAAAKYVEIPVIVKNDFYIFDEESFSGYGMRGQQSGTELLDALYGINDGRIKLRSEVGYTPHIAQQEITGIMSIVYN